MKQVTYTHTPKKKQKRKPTPLMYLTDDKGIWFFFKPFMFFSAFLTPAWHVPYYPSLWGFLVFFLQYTETAIFAGGSNDKLKRIVAWMLITRASPQITYFQEHLWNWGATHARSTYRCACGVLDMGREAGLGQACTMKGLLFVFKERLGLSCRGEAAEPGRFLGGSSRERPLLRKGSLHFKAKPVLLSLHAMTNLCTHRTKTESDWQKQP